MKPKRQSNSDGRRWWPLAALPIFTRDDAWEEALILADRGEPEYLAEIIRRFELSDAQRAWLADFVEGKVTIRRRRNSRFKYTDWMYRIPWQHRLMVEALGLTSGEAINRLAAEHCCSEATIKDVLAGRKTFAGKGLKRPEFRSTKTGGDHPA